MDLLDISLIFSITLCSLVSGFIFTYAIVVMPGLSKLNDKEFIRAFQVTDSVIQNKIQWSKNLTKIAEIDKLQIIEKDITEIELAKRIRSFNHPNFPLEVHIHNHKFVYKGKV